MAVFSYSLQEREVKARLNLPMVTRILNNNTLGWIKHEQAVKTCREAGYQVVVPVKEFRPGVSISIIEDPDGNWVEIVQRSG